MQAIYDKTRPLKKLSATMLLFTIGLAANAQNASSIQGQIKDEKNEPLTEPGNGSTELQGVNCGLLAGLNSCDIKSAEILKDASANKQYGPGY